MLIFLIFKAQYKNQQLLFKIETMVKNHHKLQELFVFLIILKLKLLHRILAPGIGQYLAKNRAMSDERCYITDAFLWRKVKQKSCKLLTSENSEVFGKYRSSALVFLFMNILIDNLFMRFFILKTVRCIWVKRFYITNLFFLPCLGQLPLWKHFIYHYITRRT